MTRMTSRKSAPRTTNSRAALKKARMRKSTECTGFLAATTMTPEATLISANSQKQMAWTIMARSSIGRVGRQVASDLRLPAVAVRQQLLLVVEKLLARLGGELEVGALDDGRDRAGLLAEAAIDAFRHVDVVARGAAAAVVARLGLDGDRECRTDRLAELAGDAALLAIGVAPERVLAAKARAERPLLVGIVHRRRRLEHVSEGERQPRDQLPEQDRPRAAIEKGHDRSLVRDQAGRHQNAGGQHQPEQRQRQKYLPAQAHELIIAEAREGGAHPEEAEQHQGDLAGEPEAGPQVPG